MKLRSFRRYRNETIFILIASGWPLLLRQSLSEISFSPVIDITLNYGLAGVTLLTTLSCILWLLYIALPTIDRDDKHMARPLFCTILFIVSCIFSLSVLATLRQDWGLLALTLAGIAVAAVFSYLSTILYGLLQKIMP